MQVGRPGIQEPGAPKRPTHSRHKANCGHKKSACMLLGALCAPVFSRATKPGCGIYHSKREASIAHQTNASWQMSRQRDICPSQSADLGKTPNVFGAPPLTQAP